jgi:hypothetical protein
MEPEYSKRQRERRERDACKQNAAAEGNQEAARAQELKRIGAAVQNIERELHAANDEETPRRRRERRWNYSGTVGLWAAAIVGGLAIYSSTRDSDKQRAAMKSQLDEMQAEERAWVSVPNGQVAVEGATTDNQGGLTLELGAMLRNTGKAPAVHAFVVAEGSVATGLPYGSWQAWQDAVCKKGSTHLEDSVFPGDQMPVHNISAYIDPRQINQRESDSDNPVVAPAVVACVIYQDNLTKQLHHTPYQFEIRMSMPRPGHGCCAIVLSDFPLKPDELTLVTRPVDAQPPD